MGVEEVQVRPDRIADLSRGRYVTCGPGPAAVLAASDDKGPVGLVGRVPDLPTVRADLGAGQELEGRRRSRARGACRRAGWRHGGAGGGRSGRRRGLGQASAARHQQYPARQAGRGPSGCASAQDWAGSLRVQLRTRPAQVLERGQDQRPRTAPHASVTPWPSGDPGPPILMAMISGSSFPPLGLSSPAPIWAVAVHHVALTAKSDTHPRAKVPRGFMALQNDGDTQAFAPNFLRLVLPGGHAERG